MTDKDYDGLVKEYEDYILKVIHACPDFNPDHWRIENDKVVPAFTEEERDLTRVILDIYDALWHIPSLQWDKAGSISQALGYCQLVLGQGAKPYSEDALYNFNRCPVFNTRYFPSPWLLPKANDASDVGE